VICDGAVIDNILAGFVLGDDNRLVYVRLVYVRLVYVRLVYVIGGLGYILTGGLGYILTGGLGYIATRGLGYIETAIDATFGFATSCGEPQEP